MAKIRIHEYAKKRRVTNKLIIDELNNMGIPVTNHMSMLDDEVVKKLDAAKIEAPKQTKNKAQTKELDKVEKATDTKNNKPATSKPSPKPAAKPAAKKVDASTKKADVKTNKPAAKPVASTTKTTEKKAAPAPSAASKAAAAASPATGGGNNRGGNSRYTPGNRFNNRRRRKPKQSASQIAAQKQRMLVPLPKKITIDETMTVSELARALGREASEVIKKLFMLGVVATINQSLEKDAVELICKDYGVEVEEEVKVDTSDLNLYFDEETKAEDLTERAAVVTIMGHVDHGKTTLLDNLRNSKVTDGEAGGITQHIGAYQLELEGKKITFLDTPGHAAFTTMRARGASITDITILVVAADDGVMPQTIEAINHAKAADVPIIVAVNKIDKPDANPDNVMQALTEHGLVPESWGGDTIFVPISAKFGQNLDELLEMVLLVAEVQELRANPKRTAIGSVIEARLDKSRGPIATLLVQDGTLNVTDSIVVGHTYGRVRVMVNDLGRRVKTAGPSTPVEITGLNAVPQAGDHFVVFADEKQARAVGETREARAVVEHRRSNNRVSLENLFEQMKEGEMKNVNVIIKADVQGSAEALAASLRKIEVEGVRVDIIHTAVGAINESDVTLAAASNAIVIGFNVRPTPQAEEAASIEKVDIRLHNIIYNAIDEIESAMTGMLDPVFEEKVIGKAIIRQTYSVSKIGTIAGTYVTDGKITRKSQIRVIRNGIVIFDGLLASLQRFKDDAKEVTTGFECGITLENFNDMKEDDIIEAYIMEEIKRKPKK
ncbi:MULTISPECIES: translation initiation factor IF-2 [Brochothrix]|uniref:Translation initiation factor IF-2 n=1 Tax=Brochothrix thermosphacta TaxID=2756 RepID=A0A1D2K5S3_BROTH|nr:MULTISPECIES: translation initiation factor IF-2 [Brochothrix]SLM98735.1 Translation initiation factor 2 [Brachybacterium faecium]ATF27118.1 translation initiation factor IF-2 [Brochothrix thermosphacta]ATH86477.1 translation initiation factor IF-2 [Brochothrix thermosphacta]MBR5526420.1 translation initiation factor IF-2 [Brochothrix sp.]MPQ28055.1 translation initiation factor IF-2 [Brochothrix thermosphacta]